VISGHEIRESLIEGGGPPVLATHLQEFAHDLPDLLFWFNRISEGNGNVVRYSTVTD